MMVQLAAAPVLGQAFRDTGQGCVRGLSPPQSVPQAHPVPAPCCGPACSLYPPAGDSVLCLRDASQRQRSIVSCVSWRRCFTSP